MAIPVSQEVKTALAAPVKQLRSVITWTGVDMVEHQITSEDRIISIKKEAEGYYFASALRKITITTFGTQMDLLDQSVQVTIQVKLPGGTWGNIPWGTFTIKEAKATENKETVVFTGYAGIYRLQERTYTGGELTFPTTVGGLLQNLATGMGLTINPEIDIDELPNADAPIAEDLWANITGTTYRDILEEIAGATGTLAVIGGGDDTLDMNPVPVDAATDTTDDAHLITFKIGQNWGPANAVVLSRQPQGDNIEVVDEEATRAPIGKNLLDPEKVMVGYGINTTTGEVGVFAERTSCYKIPVKPNTSYVVSCASGFLIGGGSNFYRQDGSFIGNTGSGWGATKNFTTDSETYYISFVVRNQASTSMTGTTVDELQMQMELGSTASSYEAFQAAGRTDVVVINNQILDKQRETTATPILDAVLGWQYREATYRTEGHGYHEIGDRIDVTIDDQTYPTIVTKSVIIVDGGINETLTSTTPEKVPIDYSKTGGITKTIYNTELAVDKQNQEIEAIVSRQDQTDETIAENYTQLLQTINNIQATVQVSGGGNLIKNSVGFGKQADGILTVWQYGTGADATNVKSQSSTASLNAGAISGHEIDLTSTSISQDVQLTAGELYNLSFRIQKPAVGSATVTITDGINTTTITAEDQTAYNWNQLNADFTPTAGSVTVTLATTNCTAAITDLMLAQGGRTGWRQASGEIYNLQVSVDQDGVQVKSATYAGDYTAITPLEFAGYSNAGGTMKKVFTINRDVTEVEKLKANSQIKMPPMEIVPIDNANYKGWAFVKSPD